MKIGVIMGGISSEKEVSLMTGMEILENLDRQTYEAYPIILDNKNKLIDKIKAIDLAFLALHGKYGEDGTIQGVLETMGIPYTGCNLLSSALCMDKDVSKRILMSSGIDTAGWLTVRHGEKPDYEFIDSFDYPLVVKPNSGGSSIGTGIAANRSELDGMINTAFEYDNEVMIEQYIEGDEITCPVLNGRLLPIVAIKPKAGFFDYTSKYSDGGADEYIVELEKTLHSKVEYAALKSYELLKCSVYARVDMIISNGKPYVLEVNTLPGMTRNSLLPKSAAHAGIPFGKLLDLIIQYSIRERKR